METTLKLYELLKLLRDKEKIVENGASIRSMQQQILNIQGNCKHELGFIEWQATAQEKDGWFHYFGIMNEANHTNYTCPLCFKHTSVAPDKIFYIVPIEFLSQLENICHVSAILTYNSGFDFEEVLKKDLEQHFHA